MKKRADSSAPGQWTRRQFGSVALALAIGGRPLFADQPMPKDPASDSLVDEAMSLLNKTAGGKQFWADVWFFHDWRIQRNALTNHCRLLDGANSRHASGAFEYCRAELDAIRSRKRLPPMQGKAVVVLHGLFRTRSSMQPLCTKLAEDGQYVAINVGYPTTRGSVADHAASLDSVIRSLEGITELNFVGHSMGNLVVRHWLGDLAAQDRTLPPGQKFGRMVMLAPPNDHPRIAAKLLSTELATLFTGEASEQLATGWDELAPKLAIPPFEFGIIAGGRGADRGYNPLLSGDNDGVVTVSSTLLAEARDFRLLPLLHSFVMRDPYAQELTQRFLQHGYFESDTARQPIPNV